VHIKKPLVKKPIPPTEKNEEVVSKNIQITLKGKLFDAKTNKAITGKVLYRVNENDLKSDSVSTNNMGEYVFKISPDDYTFLASAVGYEDSQESMDLSKISKNQQFSQNIYLNPAKKEDKQIIEEPKVELEKPKIEESITKIEENKFRLDKVFFKLGESNILPDSYEQLDGLLKILKEDLSMKIIVEGHTDNVGDPAQNKRLSIERAYNVREYLIGKGIAGSRIQFKGYGDTKPIADNSTEEGRTLNRRVEFVIL
jgi:OmpA-OmpF porin, OOP family